jgi:hypothetical protein
MKKSPFHSRNIVTLLMSLACFALATPSRAGTAYWTPGVADTNWSDPANWTGGTGTAGVPGATDSVVFGPAGTNPTAFVISNYVDSVTGNFGGTIGSLQYTNTAAYHNTLIAPGVSLLVTNATAAIASVQAAGNVFMVGGAGTGTSGGTTISGPNASLVASNTSGQVLVSQAGTAASLNLSNLDTFVTYASRVGVGVPPNYGWGIITAADGGALILAKTNYISTAFSMAPGVTTSYTNWTGWNYVAGHEIEEAIEVGNGADNSIGAASSILLGLTNGFLYRQYWRGQIQILQRGSRGGQVQPRLHQPKPDGLFSWHKRQPFGTRGLPGHRGQCDRGQSSSSGANGNIGLHRRIGRCDGGSDVFGHRQELGNTSALHPQPRRADFQLRAISTSIHADGLGAQESSLLSANNESLRWHRQRQRCRGGSYRSITRSGIGPHHHHAPPPAPAPARTSGTINITNGAVYANTIIVGALSTNNSILVNGGTLIVSNTLATNVNGLAKLSLTNSTLGLNIPASGLKVGLTTNLVTGGTTNVIEVLSVPCFLLLSAADQADPIHDPLGCGIQFRVWRHHPAGDSPQRLPVQ